MNNQISKIREQLSQARNLVRPTSPIGFSIFSTGKRALHSQLTEIIQLINNNEFEHALAQLSVIRLTINK